MKAFQKMSVALFALLTALFSNILHAQPVFSEYVEGSANTKCIEIWNSGTTSLDLDDYGYRSYFNGSTTPTYDFTLPAVTLAANEVYVICHPSAATACTDNSDGTDSRIAFDGDDAIALYEIASGNNVDIFGSIGEDPGPYWTGTCGHVTRDRTLRRLVTATSGVTGSSTGFPTLCSNWHQFNGDVCADLGTAPVEEAPLDCNPIISEYVEGTFSCKFIEVYNPCCDAIDLTNFELRIYFNACTSTNVISLTGILSGDLLPSGGTVVIYNPAETCSAYYVSGVYPSNFSPSTLLQHNGNDAVVLTYAVDGSHQDIVGNICENTVWSDATCSSSTENRTLTRISTVCSGITTDPTTGFPTLCSEWTPSTVNTVSGLGSHTSVCLDECEAGKQGASLATTAEAAGPSIVAYPNPFSGSTTLRFQVPEDAHTQLEVYSLQGTRVATLFQGNANAGQSYEITFDATHLPAGTYLYRLTTGTEQRIGKLFLAH